MSRYDFVSPGAMGSASLLHVLTQARAEQRQKLLDEINRQNTESEIRYRDENSKSLADERAAQKAFRDAQLKKIQDDEVAKGKMREGLHTFRGSHPDMESKFGSMLDLADQTGDTDLYKTIVNKYLTPEKPNPSEQWNEIRDWQGRGTGEWAQGPTHYLAQPHQEPADNGTLIGTEENGYPMILRHGKVNVDWSYPVHAKPTAKTNAGVQFSPQEIAKASALRKAATDTPPGFLGLGGKKASQPDLAAWDQYVEGTLARHPASQDVKDTVRYILANEHETTPTEDVLKQATPNFEDPQDQKDLGDLLYYLRGSGG